MNPRMLGVIALAIMTSGCVVRAVGPRPVVVAEPAVVVAQPAVVAPPPQIVVEPTPVFIAPPVLVAPPRVVLVPGTQVYTVPTASFNVFVYSGHYYSYHQGQWFHAPRHGAAVAVAAVPAQIRAVPPKHYKIPPGQERKMEREERAERCPPGLAKKGQC